jgi:hypothetical protein
MKKIRFYIYIPVTIIVVYITWIAIINNNYIFDFGYINFSKDEVSNDSSLLGTLVGLFGVVLLVETLWRSDVYRLAFGVQLDEAKFDRRPLSKMKKDILKELGII